MKSSVFGIPTYRLSYPDEDSCDECAHQEGRHYCLLHGKSALNMDIMICDDFEERVEHLDRELDLV